MATERETIFLDGETLIPEQLVQLARGTFRIDLSEEAWERVRASRVIIDRILASGEVVYGASVPVPSAQRASCAGHVHDSCHMLQASILGLATSAAWSCPKRNCASCRRT